MTTTNKTGGKAVKAYRVLGTTDDVCECGLCGRDDLKSTVALQPLDPDGGDIGEPIVLTSTGPAAQAFLAIAANIMNTTVPVTEMGGCTARDPEAVQVAISKRS